jgi:hypothetical protein
MLFTELFPFTRKLIRRLSVIDARRSDADTDPDWEILFRKQIWLRETDERFDLFSDPI